MCTPPCHVRDVCLCKAGCVGSRVDYVSVVMGLSSVLSWCPRREPSHGECEPHNTVRIQSPQSAENFTIPAPPAPECREFLTKGLIKTRMAGLARRVRGCSVVPWMAPPALETRGVIFSASPENVCSTRPEISFGLGTRAWSRPVLTSSERLYLHTPPRTHLAPQHISPDDRHHHRLP